MLQISLSRMHDPTSSRRKYLAQLDIPVGSALADAVLLSGVPENASAKADPTK